MLEHEWRELETLCERISDLRHRQSHAQRSRNSGLVEGLREDLARMRRQREQLVQHISARLSVATAEYSDHAARDAAPAAARPVMQAPMEARADTSKDIVGV